MGKYMRKSKTKGGEIGILDVNNHHHHHHHIQSSSLGVRTRAKTLALQRDDGGSYLQLRSRRLEKPKPKQKPQVCAEGKRQKYPLKDPNLPNPVRKVQGQNWNCGLEVEECLGEEKNEEIEIKNEIIINSNNSGGDDGVVEGSFGENLLEFDGRERVYRNTLPSPNPTLWDFTGTTRESTPCSLIRDPDNIQTPGSSTRPNNSSEASGRVPNSARRNIPTAHEMNDFFAGSEETQQKQFIEKYNFDPVNDKPLPGRYEWVKLDL
ncbi:hypothetical protein RND71_027084 [Anisodus tanguticus]|uniref:Cyclin-dependent kinase inhibitor domain-containing protein n=1 Tax=Anisodus tanguticus TaxID=243964 RepID=A0AAE1RM54_9SOLA|nr:hypothetical protein RND71_027084 [Anisodus tanguticus]